MSYRNRTPEEYAELYARDHGITAEEDKKTATYSAFTEYHNKEVQGVHQIEEA